MDNLDHATDKQKQAEENLKRTITELVRLHYRLMGKVYFQPLPKELADTLTDGSEKMFYLN